MAASPEELLTWKSVDVDGRRASYGVGGDGPTVVFVHGWALSGRTYRAALKRLLASGFRVFAPALPGCGDSAPLAHAPYGLAPYADWLDGFLGAVGITEPVVLMGHSLGGAVVVQTAHDYPERVRGLVLINAIGGAGVAHRPLWDWGLHFPLDVLPLKHARRVLPFVIDAALPNIVRNPRALIHAAEVARRADLTQELEELKRRRLPVVVLWGRRDELVTRASFDAMCEALGGPLAVTVDGNHSWLIAEPDRFGEIVTNVVTFAMAEPEPEALLG